MRLPSNTAVSHAECFADETGSFSRFWKLRTDRETLRAMYFYASDMEDVEVSSDTHRKVRTPSGSLAT